MPFTDQILQGFAEKVRVPHLAGILLKLFCQVAGQLLTLFLGADKGGHFGDDVGPDHVDRRSAGLQLDAELAALRTISGSLKLISSNLGVTIP